MIWRKGWIHPILQIDIVQNVLLARQGIESILFPKQQRRPLPSLLSLSFFYAPITLGVDRQDGVQYSLVGGLHSAAQPIHGRLWPGRHRLVSSAEGGPGGEGGIQVNSYSKLSKIYSIKSGSENLEAFRWNSKYNISAGFKNFKSKTPHIYNRNSKCQFMRFLRTLRAKPPIYLIEIQSVSLCGF